MTHPLENACRVMEGQPCWYVSIGGATSPSFVLVLGERVPRARPLVNERHPEEYRRCCGSVELLVWCSWRLQSNVEVMATSEQEQLLGDTMRSLVGTHVVAVRCTPPAWDLVVDFSDGRSLEIFCDHVEPGSPIAENWELWTPERCVTAGPGAQLVAEAAPPRGT